MEAYGGRSYELWSMLSDQRPVGMDVGAIKIDACEIVFNWLEIDRLERPELWLMIRRIDNTYRKSARETLKKTQEAGKNATPPKKPVRKR